MNIAHHPGEGLLLDHAAGALAMPLSLIVATHLSVCDLCRRQTRQIERVGGALLDTIVPLPLAAGALEKTLACLGEPQAPRPIPVSNDNTPLPLRDFLGSDLSDVRWKKLGPRLSYVNLYRNGPMVMRLLRGAPGTDVGSHTHRGTEYTMVLRGGFRDETGRYGPGDFQIAASDVKHNPVADLDGDCVNLAVTSDPLLFDGLVQKVVGRLFGF